MIRTRFALPLLLLLSACGGDGPAAVGLPPEGVIDTVTPPAVDTLPSDTTTGPPPDSTVSPPDPDGAYTPTHSGIPFGVSLSTKGATSMTLLPPSSLGKDLNGVVYAAYLATIREGLEVARRDNARIMISLTGNEQQIRDSKGFSMSLWKQRVDRFRGVDFSSYIEDGTLMGHFIMDEPSDAHNWNGKQVTPAEIEEMARYSKEIWPTLPTIIRAWPAYLKGHSYKYLDATWAQYHQRFGSLAEFIASNVRDSRELGLALVGGLNLLNGGTSSSGIPGSGPKRYAMGASEIRTWGTAFLDDPYFCAFMMWQYDPDYLAREDIKAALSDLSQKAARHPEEKCRRRE
jgi:hypothetical protein